MWGAQGCNLNARDISDFYKGHGITLQRYTSELGPPSKDYKKVQEQVNSIEFAHKRLLYLQNQGYDIFQLDECVFQKNHVFNYAWAPTGRPLTWDWKGIKSPDYVAVCGLISARLGKVYMNG